jgi:lauroyl/myristoyl acyltransferase
LKSLRDFIRRWSVDGDRLTRVQQWGARACPPTIEPILIFGYATLFFLVFSRGRRAVVQNLGAILPGSSLFINQLRAWCVFWNFAWTMTDAGRVRAEVGDLAWEIEGPENFRQLAEMEGGAILLTAHMGNYDIAGPTFADRFKRKLNAVRAPEHDPELQRYYEVKGDRREGDRYAVRYNAPGSMLGIDLARMLGNSEVVALQGDRVMGEVAGLPTGLCGERVGLPEGPHVLALATRCPIFPLFVVRSGWRRYRIISLAPLPLVERERGVAKSVAIANSAENWGVVLSGVLGSHWDQWFEFRPVFQGRGRA